MSFLLGLSTKNLKDINGTVDLKTNINFDLSKKFRVGRILQDYMEARWWNKVFLWTQERLGIAPGTIKATVLLETLPAAFQMNEILYELREHSAGLNCGRWDYIFSFIKKFQYDRELIEERLEKLDKEF